MFYINVSIYWNYKMKLCIGLVIDESILKIVNQLRFKYDRELVKIGVPFLPVIGPFESYTNISFIIKTLQSLKPSFTPFKLVFGEFIAEEEWGYENIYYAPLEINPVEKLYDLIMEEFFSELHDEVVFKPYFEICRFLNPEDSENILQTLNIERVRLKSQVNTVIFTKLIEGKKEYWENIAEFDMYS